MAEYTIGTKVMYENEEYTITDIDLTTLPIPFFTIENDKHMENVFGASIKPVVTSEDLLHYGEVLTDDEYVSSNSWQGLRFYLRIRTIKYNDKIYYHKMVDDNAIEWKELK